jgi:predicted HicB family RNase H-like nuclease
MSGRKPPKRSPSGFGFRTVRLPKDVREWLKRKAERNGASQNSEIIRSVRDRMDSERRARAVGPT